MIGRMKELKSNIYSYEGAEVKYIFNISDGEINSEK